jgi:hypothetical protein
LRITQRAIRVERQDVLELLALERRLQLRSRLPPGDVGQHVAADTVVELSRNPAGRGHHHDRVLAPRLDDRLELAFWVDERVDHRDLARVHLLELGKKWPGRIDVL